MFQKLCWCKEDNCKWVAFASWLSSIEEGLLPTGLCCLAKKLMPNIFWQLLAFETELIHILHSAILALLNFNKNLNFVPWIKNQTYFAMTLRQFSKKTTYMRVVGKNLDQHFKASLFSNPWDKFLKWLKTMGKICFLLLTRIKTLSSGLQNNGILKC